MLTQDLVQLGLTEKEARVYISLLHIGPSPASTLARRVFLKRASVYPVLESLVAKGLANFEERNQCRFFLPLDPECLLHNLDMQRVELKRQMKIAKKCIERLQISSHMDLMPKQKVLFFKGEDSVLKGLREYVDLTLVLQILFLDIHSGSDSAQCLHSFLSKRHNANIHLFVRQEQLDDARKLYPHFKCNFISSTAVVRGEMLIQNNKVLVILSDNQELQMMALNDSAYAKYLKEVLFEPISSS